jgi:hypothetical protein
MDVDKVPANKRSRQLIAATEIRNKNGARGDRSPRRDPHHNDSGSPTEQIWGDSPSEVRGWTHRPQNQSSGALVALAPAALSADVKDAQTRSGHRASPMSHDRSARSKDAADATVGESLCNSHLERAGSVDPQTRQKLLMGSDLSISEWG